MDGMGQSLKTLAWFSGVTAVLFLFATGDGGKSWPLVLWLFGSGIAYVISLYVHPRRNCWACRGTGRHRGWIFDYSRRACTNCDGSGWHVRLGSRLLGMDGDEPKWRRQ